MQKALRPKRDYPDWHRMLPPRFREEIYKEGGSWTFYYNTDWEGLLLYALILHLKEYKLLGGMPEWFKAYVERKEIVPFDCGGKEVTLLFEKERWVRNTLVFHLENKTTEQGMVYSSESIITPSPEFLAGLPAPGKAAVSQATWMPYYEARVTRIFLQQDWEPQK